MWRILFWSLCPTVQFLDAKNGKSQWEYLDNKKRKRKVEKEKEKQPLSLLLYCAICKNTVFTASILLHLYFGEKYFEEKHLCHLPLCIFSPPSFMNDVRVIFLWEWNIDLFKSIYLTRNFVTEKKLYLWCLISSWDHCQRSSPSRIFDPSLSSDLVEWSSTVVITTIPRHQIWHACSERVFISTREILRASLILSLSILGKTNWPNICVF